MHIRPLDVALLAASLLIPLALIWMVWAWLPKGVQKALHWLDDQIAGDFSALHRPTSVAIGLLASFIILVPAAIGSLGVLGFEISKVTSAFAEVGKSAARWSASGGVKVMVVLLLTFIAQRFVSRTVPRMVGGYIRNRTSQEAVLETEKRVRTLSAIATKTGSLLLLMGAVFMILGQLGFNLAPLLAAAGVLGLAVGFGSQTLIRDLVAGVFILMENQYRVGDVVNIAGIGGLVEDINLRRTVLRDLDYRQHFIPNGDVGVATNLTKYKSRVNLNIGVAYKEDLDKVIVVLNEIGAVMAKDPIWGPLILDPIKVLRVDNFGESAVEIKVLGETQPIRQWDVAGEFRLRVKKEFDRLGIQIPFPHRTVYWGSAPGNAATSHGEPSSETVSRAAP